MYLQSKALIRIYKKMKDYILENRDLIGQREILQLSMETANNRIEIAVKAVVKTSACLIQQFWMKFPE